MGILKTLSECVYCGYGSHTQEDRFKTELGILLEPMNPEEKEATINKYVSKAKELEVAGANISVVYDKIIENAKKGIKIGF